MHDEFFEGSNDVYKAGFKIVDVPILAAGETRVLSFYTRYGDVFGWACFALTVLNLAAIYIALALKRKVPAPAAQP